MTKGYLKKEELTKINLNFELATKALNTIIQCDSFVYNLCYTKIKFPPQIILSNCNTMVFKYFATCFIT
jgi:hypothetical protein